MPPPFPDLLWPSMLSPTKQFHSPGPKGYWGLSRASRRLQGHTDLRLASVRLLSFLFHSWASMYRNSYSHSVALTERPSTQGTSGRSFPQEGDRCQGWPGCRLVVSTLLAYVWVKVLRGPNPFGQGGPQGEQEGNSDSTQRVEG